MSLTDPIAPDTRTLADRRLDLADAALAALTGRRPSRAADALHEWIMDGIVDTLIREYPDVLEEMAMRWAQTVGDETVGRYA